ncbi:MAG: hypothetical protein GX862_11690 [Leucobacter sp.]|jgi:hypothetical protein|nr:hypothetical protein [Leucobacter sp.]
MSHIIKNIIDKLEKRFAEIVNISQPIPDSSNSTDPNSVSVQSLGPYIGVNPVVYTITVSRGGKFGVAQIDIKRDGIEIANSIAVINDTEIPIGVFGAKIKFVDLAGYSYLRVGDSWTIKCGNYKNTVQSVLLSHGSSTIIKDFPGIVFAPDSQKYGNPTSAKYDSTLFVRSELWIKSDRSEDVIYDMIDFLDDFEKVISKDVALDGVVDDLQFQTGDFILPANDRPYGVISVDMAIFYKQVM